MSGTVDSFQEKELCEKVVKGVKGVKDVDNTIRVEWPEKRTDYEIEKEVDNLKAKRAAAQDARNTVGVVIVKNRIKVKPIVVMSDQKVRENIRHALIRDPYVESYEITVNVLNGVANLYGTEDSWSEFTVAVNNAYEGRVVYVDNDLIVK